MLSRLWTIEISRSVDRISMSISVYASLACWSLPRNRTTLATMQIGVIVPRENSLSIPSPFQWNVSGLIGMTNTSVIKMLSVLANAVITVSNVTTTDSMFATYLKFVKKEKRCREN